MKHIHSQRGSALLLTLFFSALFIMMFGATLSYITAQHRAVLQEVHRIQALTAAEAGTAYYRWHLAHNPTEFSEDTGEHLYKTQSGAPYATYNLTVEAPSTGTTVATITASAATAAAPNVQGRVRARYGKPNLGHYAFISNSNAWFGENEEIEGEIHSNGGVRMDGIGDSILTSAQETYTCGPEHGCADEEKPGVWGDGEDPVLWEYPAEAIDFNSILLDLDQMKTDAQSAGVYRGSSGKYGYYVEFNADGTFTINTVTKVENPVYGYDGAEWIYESNDKKSWSPITGYTNIPIPSNGLIFLEDNVWVGGTVDGRATLVAARLPDGDYPPADIYIQDDIQYEKRDGTNTLGLMAQQDVLIPLRSNNTLRIDAAVIAINGHFFRYYYPPWNSSPYNAYSEREKIETYGTIITNLVWTWSWVTAPGEPVVSGYRTGDIIYDPDLTNNTPPYFPTEDEYAFISWEELELNQE